MFDKVFKTVENQKALQALDEQLLMALFTPAFRAGVFTGLPWQDQALASRGEVLLEQLLLLSEFYQTLNPPLSAALWGIWNAVSYLRRQRSLLLVLRENRKTNEELFVALRALAATAALQFADRTASTVVTSDAPTNLPTYRRHVEFAIGELAKLGSNHP